jgi:hypothetical protein
MKALALVLLVGCTSQRCYYPPERDVFMTRCLLVQKYADCDLNAAIQGMGIKCVDRGPEQGTTSHYSVAGQ